MHYCVCVYVFPVFLLQDRRQTQPNSQELSGQLAVVISLMTTKEILLQTGWKQRLTLKVITSSHGNVLGNVHGNAHLYKLSALTTQRILLP